MPATYVKDKNINQYLEGGDTIVSGGMNTRRKQSEALGRKSHTDSSVYVNLEKQIHAKHMVSQKER